MSTLRPVCKVAEPQEVCEQCGYALYPSGYSTQPWCDSYHENTGGPVVHDAARCGYLRWLNVHEAQMERLAAKKAAARRERREKVRRVVYYPFRLILKGFHRCRTSS